MSLSTLSGFTARFDGLTDEQLIQLKAFGKKHKAKVSKRKGYQPKYGHDYAITFECFGRSIDAIKELRTMGLPSYTGLDSFW